jgi:hypothetical protein
MREVELGIITETLRQPVSYATPADIIYGQFYGDSPEDVSTPWGMEVSMLARRIHTALYGRPSATPDTRSPLAQAEDAKRARDLGGEIGALMAGDQALTSAPWYPARPGDLVHIHYEAAGQMAVFGETYIIGDAGDGLMGMQLLAHTLPEGDEEDMAGSLTVEAADDPLYELWFEAGPQRLTIVRDGRVVHDGSRR